MFETTIYANLCRIGRGTKIVFTVGAPERTANFSRQITVIIPESYEPFTTESNEVCLFTPDGLGPYRLHQLLAAGSDGNPELRYIDIDGQEHHFALDCPIPVNE